MFTKQVVTKSNCCVNKRSSELNLCEALCKGGTGVRPTEQQGCVVRLGGGLQSQCRHRGFVHSSHWLLVGKPQVQP